ncbi:patatin-like phospholipase family protein, partial [Thioclava sp. BHET1]
MRPDSGTENSVLVLQGGGALGSYQAGAFEMLAGGAFTPDWVAGISIGAINAAIICGNPPELRVERLRAFWERVTASMPLSQFFGPPPLRSLFTELASVHTVMTGVPGFFT